MCLQLQQNHMLSGSYIPSSNFWKLWRNLFFSSPHILWHLPWKYYQRLPLFSDGWNLSASLHSALLVWTLLVIGSQLESVYQLHPENAILAFFTESLTPLLLTPTDTYHCSSDALLPLACCFFHLVPNFIDEEFSCFIWVNDFKGPSVLMIDWRQVL